MENKGESAKVLEDKTSQQPEASTSPKTYTDEEVKKQISDALAEQGRKHKSALSTTEKRIRDSLEAERESNDKEIKSFEKMMKELESDDEDRSRLAQYIRDYKRKNSDLDTKEKSLSERLLKAEAIELQEICREVAKEYENGDYERLNRLAKRIKFDDDEDRKDAIKNIADEIWPKKKPEVRKEEPRKVDSGVTTGVTTGRKPSVEEIINLRDKDPADVVAKFKSGEWTR
jgi:septal ring factor EnvC (AmiA/AmiB activator)